MRFQCLSVECGRPFGWTAKRIVTYPENEKGELITEEYVVCPYCGSLDFEELPPNRKPSKQASKPVQMPQPANFNPDDLMEHEWKGRKQGEGNYVNKGKLPKFGWDFANELEPPTISFLKTCKKQTHMIDKYRFALDGKLVKMQTVNQKRKQNNT